MTTTLAAPVTNITLAALTPDLVRSCIVLQPSPPPEPGEEPPEAIGDDDIYTPVAPGVTYENLPEVTIVDTSPDQLIGCIIDTAGNPQGRLNALFPAAIDGDGVIERSTNDIWVYDGSEWNNVGPTPGPTIVTATIIPPWNEIVRYEATVRTGLVAQSLDYALQLLTEPDPISLRLGLDVRSILPLAVPATDIELAFPAPVVEIKDESISTVVSPFEYTGNGTTQSITGLFDTGLVLLRSYGSTQDNFVYDLARGATKRWNIDRADVEATNVQTLTSFNSDGFTVGSDNLVNQSGVTYAGHAFRAPAAPVVNTVGTITTDTAVGQAYSIITYTGNGTAGATIGHGLPTAPQMVWVKRLNNTTAALAGGPAVGDDFRLLLNSSVNRSSTTALVRSTSASTITLGSGFGVNTSASTYVAYAFVDVPGVSKIGTYVGNGDPAGQFIDCGFTVDFLIVKGRDGGTLFDQVEWLVFDRTDSTGKRWYMLRAGAPFPEPNVFYQFEGKGFRALGDDTRMFANLNNNDATYVFMAFSYITPTVEPPTVNIDLAAELPLVN
jgi:hypothetical protein